MGTRTFAGLSMILLPVWLSGCSEESSRPVEADPPPETRILHPYSREPQVFVVSDSIVVYAGARDLGARGAPGSIESLVLYFKAENEAEPTRIGEMDGPISVESVADTAVRRHLVLPEGWDLYRRRWYTGAYPPPPLGTPVISGAEVRLVALAADGAGNTGRSVTAFRILVYNHGPGHPCVFRPVFIVTPVTGTVDTDFAFDPRGTEDFVEDEHIRVRWDFDGDPDNGWDLDWPGRLTAARVVHHQFPSPGVWVIRMEAHTSYLPEFVVEAQPRLVRVAPSSTPEPPDPENYVFVSAGDYPISKRDSTFVLDGRREVVDASELPAHLVRISGPYRISRYEVTNQQYLAYLERAMEVTPPLIDRVSGAIFSVDAEGQLGPLLCELAASRIFLDADLGRLTIRPEDAQHPVTGVTWDGANAYAQFYGLRLPSEAEWEAAGRGTRGDLDYPFPDGIDLRAAEGRVRVNYQGAREGTDPFVAGTTPVGFYDGSEHAGFSTIDTRSEFGLYDLAGNVAEWVWDWHGPYLQDELQVDPGGPLTGTHRVVRGGGYAGTRVDCRATSRRGYVPETASPSIGFRCAFTLLD